MALLACSGANETQGRFFKGVKGIPRPGAVFINVDLSFFLSNSKLKFSKFLTKMYLRLS